MQRPSVKEVDCQTYSTPLLANHSSECLLQSLQSAMPIQTESSDEGGLKTGQKPLTSKL